MGRQKPPHRASGYRLAVVLEEFGRSKKFATSQCASQVETAEKVLLVGENGHLGQAL